jgi:hypothetical protein
LNDGVYQQRVQVVLPGGLFDSGINFRVGRQGKGNGGGLCGSRIRGVYRLGFDDFGFYCDAANKAAGSAIGPDVDAHFIVRGGCHGAIGGKRGHRQQQTRKTKLKRFVQNIPQSQ